MPRTMDIRVTNLRVSRFDPGPVDVLRLQASLNLDRPPEFNVQLAEPGCETGKHIPHVHMTYSKRLAEGMDSPWGPDAMVREISELFRRLFGTHSIVSTYEVAE